MDIADTPEDSLLPDAGDPGLALPGFEAAPASGGYQVLARKYRPQRFADLIGQEPMVRTLAHAFQSGRIAQAYMLTGVRGVGKTTTARLIARALNYESDERTGPTVEIDPPGRHCDAIARSAHVDVLEMDAASRTGVGDIREILDGVRYAPVSARYKVYIIDEVHMLSNNAFNALLKTLEEPPPHVKFIFATTEIRKVPVTVLSRCQRFDLRRVPRDMLSAHLARICEREGAQVEDAGLDAIARAAEGSVRDALSLLDQAIVQGSESGPVPASQVREMLGLVDRSRVLDLLDAALTGKGEAALSELESQYAAGADPQVLMRDLLDYLHAMNRVKATNGSADLAEAPETAARLRELAGAHSLASLTRLWKTALSGLEDVRSAPDPMAAVEMSVIRLMAAASLPGPEEAARLIAALESGAPLPSAPQGSSDAAEGPAADAGPQADNAVPSADGPSSLEELLALLDREREVMLHDQVERFVRLASIGQGKLVYEAAKGAPEDLPSRLAGFLHTQTGARWLVDSQGRAPGAETVRERRRREADALRERALRDPAVVRAMTLFPGAELESVTPLEPAPQPTQMSGAETQRQERKP
ncbi:MAG: DNA polymerase III subunit gamma/tau [Caulobacterales bacterium]|uniref:DNA polymerase III subunit gamma/tau n=1 Tax=Glycocaulis sp. TaxID=1969725 RepID=UPI003F9ED3E6